ncbi:MAG TPA: hypothetical protein VN668_15045 [Stellaceae bacterium]|nr:hypothetical protein [Stellaceae bacterium]
MADFEERVLDNPNTAYETQDVRLMVVGVLALLILALLVIVPLILRGAYPAALADANRKQTVIPPSPLLQTAPAADLRAFRAEEEARLDSYGWVDRDKGIVHIPIARAMKEVVAKGISGFPKATP